MASTDVPSRFAALRDALPQGGALPEDVWLARHRGICVLLWLSIGALAVIGIFRSSSLRGSVLGFACIAAFAVAAMHSGFGKSTRSSLATLGLLGCCAILIGYFGGLIEAHFSFFVVIAVVSLYQSWRPYLIAIGYVLLHHLVLGTLAPQWVYDHHAAMEHPWSFALIHGGAVLAESVACLVVWRVTENALDAERASSQALKQANAELSHANLAVADLVAMLSHDLRIPLAVLIGYSEMALESWTEMSPDERFDFVGRVGKAGGSLLQLLNDTLTVSEIDAEGVTSRRAPVRVDDAVRQALATLPEPRPTPDLELLQAATAEVDPGQLAQVLTNLLTNATKYGGGGFSVSSREDGDCVYVAVADSGPGVDAAFVPNLFDRFTRSEDARRGPQKGTGLGLYITQNLVVASGGTIHYEPTPGGGATFCLQLRRPQNSPELVGDLAGHAGKSAPVAS